MAKNGLTEQQVGHVAKLANLPLTTSEVKTFQKQLSKVVGYVSKISNLPGPAKRSGAGKYQISNIRKTPEAGLTTKGRKDEAEGTKCLSQEDALSGTENKHNGLFVVPAIFEE